MFIPAIAEAGIYFPSPQHDYQLYELAGKKSVTPICVPGCVKKTFICFLFVKKKASLLVSHLNVLNDAQICN